MKDPWDFEMGMHSLYWDTFSRHLSGMNGRDFLEFVEYPDDISDRMAIREQLVAECWGYAEPV